MTLKSFSKFFFRNTLFATNLFGSCDVFVGCFTCPSIFCRLIQALHIAIDVHEHLQVVAMAHSTGLPFSTDIARAGVHMLQAHGQSLENLPLEPGLLERMALDDQQPGSRLLRSRIGVIKKHFVDVFYVFVPAAGHEAPVGCRTMVCTCESHCRYEGCERIEFLRVLDLRLRAKESSPDDLPTQRRHGRKPGPKKTIRGEQTATKP